ncbi:MAG TPA: MTH1187 family thiamine-binding protein [Thermoplasmata archaeon]|nr:MTH1187 family thiamine-binding protein [Thermoplasmata archaeon]
MPSAKRAPPRVIGDVSIYPIGAGTSLGDHVRAASKAMKTVTGVRLVPGPMSTAVEAGKLDDIFVAVKRAHAALLKMGAQRVAIILRIDHRLDKPETLEYKVSRIKI